MALGEAEDDIDALRQLLDAGNDDYFEIASKIAILEGAHHLLDRDIISTKLYKSIIGEVLNKNITLSYVTYYAGLT